ncbi:Caffeic acid 3-O-methyltransferase [Hibiscus syriacus]|uniref:Caffeic acid 3-O-methyltransferase n=1 Tax=Hibiscus syriacus TaxID=106335 RepID=A0A6A3D4H4_HIBSY|nr:caffeic acid 3-O-methyltransferase-like [Hibiscus syriacus]KAE8734768.1 Caffeic acid 3-O-methyltransferase [Hibiscus syriacus]
MESSAENQIEGNNKNWEHDEESFAYAGQIANSCAMSMSMHAAIQMDIFEIIAKAGPDAKLSPKDIAAHLPTTNPEAASMLDRMLRLLATHGIVGCSMAEDADEEGNPQRLYALTPVSRFFVRNEDGVSLAPVMALHQDKVFLDSWSQLKDAILEGGIPFNRVHGMNAFEYTAKDPRFNQVFNTAMKNHTTMVMRNILNAYTGFADHLGQVIVDVGGGLGVSLSFITSKYPSIKGINYDLPHVIQHAPPIPGVEHVAGDMFQNVPKGDAIFMKFILHDWSDDHCLKLLKNCYNAIPDNGKVIVVDAVLPVLPETNAQVRCISQVDAVMMTQNPGGKERTRHEFQALATKAGFSCIRYECYVCSLWVMEFFK